MIKGMVYVFVVSVVSIGITGCSSSSSGGSGVSYTAGGQAFKTIDSALGGAEGLISGSVATSSVQSNSVTTSSAGLTAKWEVATSYNNPKYNPSDCPTSTEPSMITLKEYMGTQFESTQKRCNGSAINIFGRLDNSAGITCIMMNTLSAATSAEMATADDMTFTMDAATKASLSVKCPMMAADLANESAVPTGTVVTLAFDMPAVTTTYDLKVTIQPFNNTVFLKYGGTEINIATNESNSNGSQRALVSYNSTTKILRAEYVSKSNGTHHPLYVHRLYMDDTTQQARILSGIYSGYSSQSDTTADNKETYIVSGHPSSSTLAFSIDLVSMGTLTDGTHEACVNGDTGAITNDAPTVSSNAFTCGTTAATSKAIPYATAISTISSQTDDALPTTWWALTTGSEVLNWTDRDNMLTQGL